MKNKYSIFNGTKYFPWIVSQNYLVFIWANNKFEFFSSSNHICSCKSKQMSEERIKNLPTPSNSFTSILIGFYPSPDAKFGGNILRHSTHKNVLIYLFLTD